MSAPLPRQPSDELIFHGERVDFILRPTASRAGTGMDRPSGGKKREVVLHPGAVIVLPLLDDGRIVMIKNHRHTVNETLLELCAGTLERDDHAQPEDPAACAARELTEETGYTAGKIDSLGWFYTSPGILTEKMYAFLATSLTPGTQNLEENEQIEVVVMRAEEIKRLIRENRIVDAKSIATLLKYFVDSGR
ncbi:MAG TPA: NUDIX hydrolase [Phycisphaerae bacterium]|jgi:ADP-ribose pyrophosphatase